LVIGEVVLSQQLMAGDDSYLRMKQSDLSVWIGQSCRVTWAGMYILRCGLKDRRIRDVQGSRERSARVECWGMIGRGMVSFVGACAWMRACFRSRFGNARRGNRVGDHALEETR
jgi:hypothetical protein